MAALENRAARALRRRSNWTQLLKFGTVGASGYAVNLAVYTLLVVLAGLGPHEAAVVSFVVAAANNYWWNRSWTFAGSQGHFAYQGMRFFTVSCAALLANQILLYVFLNHADLGKIAAQALAIVLVMPLNFAGNKLWSFR